MYLQVTSCSGCKLAKMSSLPFNKSASLYTLPFCLFHPDVWGPSLVSTKGGSTYYVYFIDDYSRYCWVYLMAHKSDFSQIYCNFHSIIHTQFSIDIKVIRSDLGVKHWLKDCTDFLGASGTIHQSSCSGNPEQNGFTERKDRHVLETAGALLFSISIPSIFWVKLFLQRFIY